MNPYSYPRYGILRLFDISIMLIPLPINCPPSIILHYDYDINKIYLIKSPNLLYKISLFFYILADL
jgi:hypothetical protein